MALERRECRWLAVGANEGERRHWLRIAVDRQRRNLTVNQGREPGGDRMRRGTDATLAASLRCQPFIPYMNITTSPRAMIDVTGDGRPRFFVS